MSAQLIEAWISVLGVGHDELLKRSLISGDDFIEIFPDDNELYLEPLIGISMSFWAETERFEALHITLLKSTPSTVEYTGSLPEPYSLRMDQAKAHAILGKPLEYSGPIRMPEPMGQTGGWESYALDPSIYPNVRLHLQYLESMEVSAIVFSLIDKGHM